MVARNPGVGCMVMPPLVPLESTRLTISCPSVADWQYRATWAASSAIGAPVPRTKLPLNRPATPCSAGESSE